MSNEFNDYELRYSFLENQAFALVRVVKYFKAYVLNNTIKSYGPNLSVKMMLS